MTMIVGDRRIEGVIQRKAEARATCCCSATGGSYGLRYVRYRPAGCSRYAGHSRDYLQPTH